MFVDYFFFWNIFCFGSYDEVFLYGIDYDVFYNLCLGFKGYKDYCGNWQDYVFQYVNYVGLFSQIGVWD